MTTKFHSTQDMNFICEIVESGKNRGSPFSKKEPKDPLKQEILAGIGVRQLVALDGEISLINQDGVLVWEKPFKIEGKPNKAYVSDDRILLTTFTKEYHAWGFLGPVYMLDMKDGSVVAELKGESGAALRDGRFLLGLEGYDNFDTWLYDRDGSLVQEWRSYGNYIIGENDDIRVVEKDRNIPTKSRVVRLNQEGKIEKGPRLIDSQITEQLVLDDNSIMFIDAGTVRIVDLKLKEKYNKSLMKVSERDAWRFHSKIRFIDNRIKVNIYEQTEESPIEYTNHYWLLDLKH